jgi:hypothetical protein
VILDFLNEKLLWREQKKEKVNPGEDASYSMEEVRIIKSSCLENPNEKLWRGPTRNIQEVRTIFNHLNELRYEDKPDYGLIRNCLKSILVNNEGISRPLSTPRNMMLMPAPCTPTPVSLGHPKTSLSPFMAPVP